jgi:hypothetical protein
MSKVPLVDAIEMVGSAVEAGGIELVGGARILVDHAEGGLTLLGAMHLAKYWREARAEYERLGD